MPASVNSRLLKNAPRFSLRRWPASQAFATRKDCPAVIPMAPGQRDLVAACMVPDTDGPYRQVRWPDQLTLDDVAGTLYDYDGNAYVPA